MNGATCVAQTESSVGTVGSNTSVNSVNGVNACNLSACSGSADVPNTSVNSCDNKNAGSGLTQITPILANSSDIHGKCKSSTPAFYPGPPPIFLP